MGRPLNDESGDVGCRVSFSRLYDLGQVTSGPQNPLLNDEGLDLVNSQVVSVLENIRMLTII